MWGFGFGGFGNLQKRAINRKEFGVVVGHLAPNLILRTGHIVFALSIGHDFGLNACFAKGMTTGGKNPGDSFFGIFNPAKRTRELSFHPK